MPAGSQESERTELLRATGTFDGRAVHAARVVADAGPCRCES